MLVQVEVPKKTEYEFIQTQKCKVDSNGIPSNTCMKFKMMSEEKTQKSCTFHILAAKLAVADWEI